MTCIEYLIYSSQSWLIIAILAVTIARNFGEAFGSIVGLVLWLKTLLSVRYTVFKLSILPATLVDDIYCILYGIMCTYCIYTSTVSRAHLSSSSQRDSTDLTALIQVVDNLDKSVQSQHLITTNYCVELLGKYKLSVVILVSWQKLKVYA